MYGAYAPDAFCFQANQRAIAKRHGTMTLKGHVVQAVIGSAIMTQFLSPVENAVFFLSVIFIDVDHYFDFVIVTGRFKLGDMFKFHGWLWKHKDTLYGLSVFHTIEVFLALYFLGHYNRYFTIILYGFLYHMALDLITLYWYGMFFNRAFSIAEYFIKKRITGKGYPVPEQGFWR